MTSTFARVSWDESIDDIIVKNYVVFLDGVRYATVPTASVEFPGLTAATTYSVQVQAVDAGNNASELSALFEFITLA